MILYGVPLLSVLAKAYATHVFRIFSWQQQFLKFNYSFIGERAAA